MTLKHYIMKLENKNSFNRKIVKNKHIDFTNLDHLE